MRLYLKTTAAVSALLVDPKSHAQIKSEKDEGGLKYKSIKEKLRLIQARATDIEYVYTFRKTKDEKIVFVVDAGEKETEILGSEGTPRKSARYRNSARAIELYASASPELLSAFQKPYHAVAENTFYEDKWGLWLSGFAPIIAEDGSVEAVIGIDMSAEHILAIQRKHLEMIAGITISAAIASILLSLVFSNLVSKPIRAVVSELERIRMLDFSQKELGDSGVSEIQTMFRMLDKMKLGLRAFRRHVPADLVSLLILSGKEARVGGQKREISILFSDIENFSALCEALPQDNLDVFLETYFEAVARCIVKNQGTLDKFIGDATMSFLECTEGE